VVLLRGNVSGGDSEVPPPMDYEKAGEMRAFGETSLGSAIVFQ
jgi:hypothetical protein